MPVQQITVFLENQAGSMAEVAKILKDHDINLQGFSTTEARDYGILRLVVSDTQKAREFLIEAGFTTNVAEVICSKVEDKPGQLSRILEILAGQQLNVDYIYVIADTKIVLSVKDIKRAEQVLAQQGAMLCQQGL